MFNIVSAWGLPTNHLVTVEVNDTSCGDFGSRYYVDVIADDYHWRFVGGTMADASIDAPEEIDDVLASISGVLGVNASGLIAAALSAADLCARQEVCYAD